MDEYTWIWMMMNEEELKNGLVYMNMNWGCIKMN